MPCNIKRHRSGALLCLQMSLLPAMLPEDAVTQCRHVHIASLFIHANANGTTHSLSELEFPPFLGEINTLQGNLNWVSSREHSLTHPVWDGREDEFLPICNQAESDSANLDHIAEYAVRTGVDANQTLMMLVPEAYRNHPDLKEQYPEVTYKEKDIYKQIMNGNIDESIE